MIDASGRPCVSAGPSLHLPYTIPLRKRAVPREWRASGRRPTGTGKSLACLAPALLSGEKVVVSTATLALQHQLLAEDLPPLRAAVAKLLGYPEDEGFSYAVMKGRSNFLALVMVAWRGRAESRFAVAILCPPLRSGTCDQVLQRHARLDDASREAPRAGRSVDLVDIGDLRATSSRQRSGRRSQFAL